MALSEFLKAMEVISNIKKQEVPLPIARKTAVVSPLRVGDDLSLRSSLTSPVNYDRQMTRLIFDLTEFIASEGQPLVKENFEYYCKTTSNIDKICLIWGLYKTTYETLGRRTFKCDKENCKHEFKQDVMLDSLIQEDTFYAWDEEIPFHEYIFEIVVPYEQFEFIFESKIPSISDNNRVLSNLSIDSVQENFQTGGNLFSRSEQMTLLNRSVAIKSVANPNNIPKTENMQEMLIAFRKHVPLTVSEKFFVEYNKKFDKYYTKFYTEILCPQCGNKIKYTVDLESEFFRRSIFSGGEGVEEL